MERDIICKKADAVSKLSRRCLKNKIAVKSNRFDEYRLRISLFSHVFITTLSTLLMLSQSLK
jgi:hypothetical protein